MLAGGLIVDVKDLTSEPEYTRHLKEYGLLEVDAVGRPSFAIPVVGQHIGNELARREGRRLVRRVIALEERAVWVKRRTEAITREIRELGRMMTKKGQPTLFGSTSFPEAERFAIVKPAATNDEFVAFINVCNRCFVESIEQFGRTQASADYFWTVVKSNYPDIWDALQRIKTYRHNDLHLELNSKASAELARFLELDLERRRLSQVPEVWFILQQSVLDGLLVGIQCELNRLT